jgi:hypothetical protein
LPTLFDYRQGALEEEGGVLGVTRGTVTLDPDIADRDAARSLIAARLFDDEKLSAAYGSQYVWIPRTSDQRRTLMRGYRLRYVSVFAPPDDGSYRLQFFGYGQTRELPYSSSARTVEQEIRKLSPDLASVEVETDPLGLAIYLATMRIGIGATRGRMIAQGGVGVSLVNRDFSTPLKKGTPFLMSPRIPFETEDELLGLHNCINLALSDITEPDLVPVTASLPSSQRSGVVRLVDVAPWATPDMVLGFYAPTDWLSITTFRPPTSGTYLLRPQTSIPWLTIATPLAYNASGLEIETALAALVGPRVRVVPEGVATEYQIGWRTQHYEATVTASSGSIVAYQSNRLRQPYPCTVAPGYQRDFEAGTFSEPGYPEDQTWFIELLRPASTRICPQVWPRRRDGSYDYSQDPLPGEYWVDSVTGLVHDLDQAMPPVSQVAPAALRYACLAIANVVPAGESQRWEALAQRSAMHAAARVVYGKQRPRALRSSGGVAPERMEKSWPYFNS